MSKITEAIAGLAPDAQYFSLEFFPPKTSEGLQNLYPRLSRLRALQPLFVCVTFGAGGTTVQKSLQLADICQNSLGFRTCLHLTCTNSSREVIDGVLTEAKRLGLRNILALRGDEPRPGEYSHAANGTAQTSKTNGVVKDSGEESQPADHGSQDSPDVTFSHAVDLIRYIRSTHGDYFCIGAAAYPEGHPVASAVHVGAYSQSAAQDLPYLKEKVEAGAEFLLTQLFYDATSFLQFEKLLQEDSSGVFKGVPIIPGLMPVQGWQSFARTCKLARVGLPAAVSERLAKVKGDDAGVKSVGVDVVSEIVETIQKSSWTALQSKENNHTKVAQGFHFYTLNLEKALAQILERSNLVPPSRTTTDESAIDSGDGLSPEIPAKRDKRRRSSAHNRVVVSNPKPNNAEFEASEARAGKPREKPQTSDDALAIAEGEGSLGRAATWDDFPNGRWGDARSPAYAPTNNYTLHPNLSRTPALKLWSTPTSVANITSLFRRYLLGTLSAIPWSDEDSEEESGLRPETAMIKDELLKLNDKGWWTVASQPAVNAVSSGDDVVGWGPRKGGFVFQKPFVEMFLPSKDWLSLKKLLDDASDEVVYFAGNAAGDFDATDKDSVNPVTWGAFKGKEIITPTIVEAVSFRAWQDEAFGIWHEWRTVFHPSSPSAKLLGQLRDDVWLVNVIGHDYIGGRKLWQLLTEE